MSAAESVDEVLAQLAQDSVRAQRVQEYHAGERERRRVKTRDLLAVLEQSEGQLVATRETNAGRTQIAYTGEGRDPWLVWSYSEIHAQTEDAGPAEQLESAFTSEVQELLEDLPVSLIHARNSRLARQLGHTPDDHERVPMVSASRGPIELVYGPDPDAYERVHGNRGEHL